MAVKKPKPPRNPKAEIAIAKMEAEAEAEAKAVEDSIITVSDKDFNADSLKQKISSVIG